MAGKHGIRFAPSVAVERGVGGSPGGLPRNGLPPGDRRSHGRKTRGHERGGADALARRLAAASAGPEAVQEYVDAVCGQMHDAHSPGHHVVVAWDGTVLQSAGPPPRLCRNARRRSRRRLPDAPIGRQRRDARGGQRAKGRVDRLCVRVPDERPPRGPRRGPDAPRSDRRAVAGGRGVCQCGAGADGGQAVGKSCRHGRRIAQGHSGPRPPRSRPPNWPAWPRRSTP